MSSTDPVYLVLQLKSVDLSVWSMGDIQECTRECCTNPKTEMHPGMYPSRRLTSGGK